jgi:hypothetical protein
MRNRAHWSNIALRTDVFCVAALLLFTASNMRAQATTDTYRETVPVFQDFYTCDGDFVTLLGEDTTVFHITADDSGGFHVGIKAIAKLEGVGDPSGETYRLIVAFEFQDNVEAGTERTISNPVILVGPGSAGNLQVHETFHYTINANGEPTAYFDNLTFHCQD